MKCLSRGSPTTHATPRRRKCRPAIRKFTWRRSRKSSDFAENPRKPRRRSKARRPAFIRSSSTARSTWRAAITMPAITANTPRTARGSFIILFSPRINFPAPANWIISGLPESGDGKSDLLQEAKWEADFLAKMQDADGGFYFLVYPREREYEIDVTARSRRSANCLSQNHRGDRRRRGRARAMRVVAEVQTTISRGRRAAIWRRQKRAGPFSSAPSRNTARTARIKKSRITAMIRCTTTNSRGRRANCFSPRATRRSRDKLAQWLKPSEPDTRLLGLVAHVCVLGMRHPRLRVRRAQRTHQTRTTQSHVAGRL